MRYSQREIAFNERWGDLAQYNAEVSRGIVHTDEWKAKMADKQSKYNRMIFLGKDLAFDDVVGGGL